jgi:MAF protein
VGIPFKVIPSRLAEPPPPDPLDPITYTKRLALAKAKLVARQVGSGWVLGADTVVVHRGQILGKPEHFADACRMLTRLQGTTHRVITSVALVDAATGKVRWAHAVSRVTMRRLTPQEIARTAHKHQDKAGAYAVQEKRDPLVTRVQGSTTNVVGLPLELVKKLLKRPIHPAVDK